jgi:hypothetical protein
MEGCITNTVPLPRHGPHDFLFRTVPCPLQEAQFSGMKPVGALLSFIGQVSYGLTVRMQIMVCSQFGQQSPNLFCDLSIVMILSRR